MRDIYDDKQRDKMLEDDEIAAEEEAFIAGRDMKLDKKKKRWTELKNTLSVELVGEEYKEE